MLTLVPPCKDCSKKGCGAYHSECKPYQEFVEKQKEFRKKIEDRKRRDYCPTSYY